MPTATTWYRSILLIFWFAPGLLNGQVIRIDDSFRGSININPHLEVYQLPQAISPKEVEERIADGRIETSQNLSSPGFSKDFFWLKFLINSTGEQDLVLELDNPHIDEALLYRANPSGWELIGKGGDKHPFAYRTIYNRRYLFPVASGEYLMMIDKRNAAVSFPMKLWDYPSFNIHDYNLNLILGIYFGILLFVSVFSLIVGVALREMHFLSYAAYVGLFFLYMFTQLGFSFEFLYPDSVVLNNYSRLFLAFALTIASMDFFSRLLDVKHYLPKVYKLYQYAWLMLGAALVFWIVNKVFNPDYAVYTIYILNLLYFFIFAFFVSTFYVSFKTWKYQPGNILLILAAFSALMVGTAIYIFVEYGIISESLLPINPIMLGSVLEIMILSISMVYRVKTINDRKNDLSEKLLKQQKDMMRAYIQGGDSERHRISSELHDHIGSGLSLLKSKIMQPDQNLKEVANEIDQLCKEVRDLSHQLVPHQIKLVGFTQVIKDYCRKFENDTGIEVDIEGFDVPQMPEEVTIQLLRIVQEAMQNILNHARATLIEVQMIGYQDELVITVDDNGVGFDPNHTSSGNGLLNMKSRVQSLRGFIDISSHKGKGTNIIITLPLDNNESVR